MNTTRKLVKELERLASALGPDDGNASRISLPSVADRIAKNLSVKSDEVAILALSPRSRRLHFLTPEALRNIGSIPLSSNSALAARTARESRPEIDNKFSMVRQEAVYEGVKIAAETAEAIHKIISAPILAAGKVVGVIQISRKGADEASAGLDFTADDLGKVLALCKPLGKLLQHVAVE